MRMRVCCWPDHHGALCWLYSDSLHGKVRSSVSMHVVQIQHPHSISSSSAVLGSLLLVPHTESSVRRCFLHFIDHGLPLWSPSLCRRVQFLWIPLALPCSEPSKILIRTLLEYGGDLVLMGVQRSESFQFQRNVLSLLVVSKVQTVNARVILDGASASFFIDSLLLLIEARDHLSAGVRRYSVLPDSDAVANYLDDRISRSRISSWRIRTASRIRASFGVMLSLRFVLGMGPNSTTSVYSASRGDM